MPNTFDQSSAAFLASLDAEIERLQSIRQQIAEALHSNAPAKQPAVRKPKRKGMSEEGRRKIAAAQKARWARQKKEIRTAAKKTGGEKVAAKKAASKRVTSKKSGAAKTAEQA